MHCICSACDDDVHTRVDQQLRRRSRSGRVYLAHNLDRSASQLHQFACGEILFPKLNGIDPCGGTAEAVMVDRIFRHDRAAQYNNPALKQLADQQVRFAPPARRLEQLARAERLLAEIDPARQYPYAFVCFRITDFRPDSYPDLLFVEGT